MISHLQLRLKLRNSYSVEASLVKHKLIRPPQRVTNNRIQQTVLAPNIWYFFFSFSHNIAKMNFFLIIKSAMLETSDSSGSALRIKIYNHYKDTCLKTKTFFFFFLIKRRSQLRSRNEEMGNDGFSDGRRLNGRTREPHSLAASSALGAALTTRSWHSTRVRRRVLRSYFDAVCLQIIFHRQIPSASQYRNSSHFSLPRRIDFLSKLMYRTRL